MPIIIEHLLTFVRFFYSQGSVYEILGHTGNEIVFFYDFNPLSYNMLIWRNTSFLYTPFDNNFSAPLITALGVKLRDLFINVAFQLPGEHAVRLLFRGLQLGAHIAISDLLSRPTHVHVIEEKHMQRRTKNPKILKTMT